MADLLGADLELAEIHKLYECHERLLKHKAGTVHASDGPLERFVQRAVRRAALRFDQHVF